MSHIKQKYQTLVWNIPCSEKKLLINVKALKIRLLKSTASILQNQAVLYFHSLYLKTY